MLIQIEKPQPPKKRPATSFDANSELYRELTENTDDLICVLSLDLRLTYANPAFNHRLGYTFDELHRADITTIFSAKSLESARHGYERIRKAIHTQADKQIHGTFELELKPKLGGMFWLDVSYRVLHDKRNRPSGFLLIGRDITSRKRMEHALREGEERFRGMFDQAAVGIAEITIDGYPLLVNPKFCEILQYTQQEIPRTNLFAITYADDLPEKLQRVKLLLEGTIETFSIEERYIKKDGNTTWVRLTSRLIRDEGSGIPKYFLAVFEDINEQKENEQALETLYKSGLFLNQLMDSNAIAGRVIGILSERINWSDAGVWLCKEDSEELELAAYNRPGLTEKQTLAEKEKIRALIQTTADGLAGWVIRNGESIHSRDPKANPNYIPILENVATALYVPLKSAERVLGCIYLDHTDLNAFSPSDEQLVKIIAAQATTAIENARLYQDILKASQHRSILYLASQKISLAGIDLEKIYLAIHEAATQLMSLDIFTVTLYDEYRKKFNDVYIFKQGKRADASSAKSEHKLSEYVLRLGSSLLIRDYQADEHPEIGDIVPGNGTTQPRSILAVPIKSSEKVIGVASIQSYQPDKFSLDDQNLMGTLATYAGSAIDNARLFVQTQQRAQELEALVEMTKAMTSTIEMQPLLENILSIARETIPGAEKGTIILSNEDGSTLHIRAASGYQDPQAENLQLNGKDGYAAQVIHSGRPALIKDVHLEAAMKSPPIDEIARVRSAVAAPLIVKGKTIGAICLDNLSRKAAFTEQDLHLLAPFAASAAIAIENARLFEQTKQHAQELLAVSKVSSALRGVFGYKEIITTTLDQILEVLASQNASLVIYDKKLHKNIIEEARGDWSHTNGLILEEGEGIIGLVTTTRKPYNSETTKTRRKPVQAKIGNKDQAAIGIPLIAQDEIIGSIWVGRDPLGKKKRPFSSEEISLLTSIADITANALHRVALFQQTAQQADQMETISRLGFGLAEAADLPEMYREFTATVDKLFANLDEITVYIAGSQDNFLACVCNYRAGNFEGVDGIPKISLTKPGKRNIGLQAFETRHPVIVNLPKRVKRNHGSSNAQTKGSVLWAPLVVNSDVIGVIRVKGKQQRRFVENDAQILTVAANTAAVEIQNAQLLEDARQRAQQLVHINELGRTLAETLEVGQVYERLAAIALDLLPASATLIISRYDARNQMISAVYSIQDGKTFDVSGLPRIPLLPPGKGAQSEAIHTARPFLIKDLMAYYREKHIKYHLTGESGPLTKSAIYVPMVAHGTVIGVLQLQSYQKDAYSQPDAELLGLVANTAAVAIENAGLYEQTRQHSEQLARLNEFGRELAKTLSPEAVYQTAYLYANQFLDCPGFEIDLIDEAHKRIWPVFILSNGKTVDAARIPPVRYDVEGDARAQAIATAQPVVINNPAGIKQTSDSADELHTPPMQSALYYAPMVVEGKTIGLIEFHSFSSEAYDEEKLAMANTIANQVGLSIQNARLFNQIERQIEQLSSLRNIDAAINSNTDLESTLKIILGHVKSQLHVDAAAILLLDEKDITIKYKSGIGFRTNEIKQDQVHIGIGIAGQAVLEHKTVVSDNVHINPNFARKKLVALEGFCGYASTPLVSKGKLKGILEVFHRSSLKADVEWTAFFETMANEATIAIDNAYLLTELQRSNQELTMAYEATIEGWAQALELRDAETEGHSRRVVKMTLDLAVRMGIQGRDLVHIRHGGLLHDIGKMGVPDQILHKPGPLTEEEWSIMRQHPTLAYQLLSQVPYLTPALEIPYCHHEKWDGSGYPRGLKGEQIPFSARIFAIVDVYDALTNDRPYRKAMKKDEVLTYLRAQSGKHFDPSIVEPFIEMVTEPSE